MLSKKEQGQKLSIRMLVKVNIRSEYMKVKNYVTLYNIKVALFDLQYHNVSMYRFWFECARKNLAERAFCDIP